MIPNIPQQGPMQHMAHRPAANRPVMPGSTESAPAARNASAPGQVAKAMIAEAVAGGAELPANIQGKAASAIAHGMDMESFFAAFMPVVEPPANDVPAGGEGTPPADAGDGAIAEPGTETPAPESGATPPPAPASDGEMTMPPKNTVASSYQIAAALVEPLIEPESETVV